MFYTNGSFTLSGSIAGRIKFIIQFLFFVAIFCEVLVYNIGFDLLLVLLCILTSISFGSFFGRFFKTQAEDIAQENIRLVVGIGIFGWLVWLLNILPFKNRPTFMLLLFLAVIVVRRKQVLTTVKMYFDRFRGDSTRTPYIPYVLTAILIIFIPLASFPITGYDSLVKHLSLPMKIVSESISGLSLVEGVYFGESSLLGNLFSVFFLSFSGQKSLILFNLFVSFACCCLLLDLCKKLDFRTGARFLVVLTYFSIPMIVNISTQLVVDLFPVLFLLTAISICLHYKSSSLVRMTPFIFLAMGFALFSKQSAISFILPSILFCMFLVIKEISEKRAAIRSSLCFLSISTLIFLSSFVPSLILQYLTSGNPVFPFFNSIFHSQYFGIENFKDPYVVWNRYLGFDYQSVYNMVFDTTRNTEYVSGGIGYYLLGLLFIPISLFIAVKKRNLAFLAITFLALSAYYIGTLTTYNTRYFLPSLVIVIPAIVYIISVIVNHVSNRFFRIAFILSLSLLIIVPNIVYIAKYIYTPNKLRHHSELALTENQSVLKYINYESAKVLSYNDPFRADFIGNFYNTNWYGTFLTGKVISGEVSVQKFLQSFDFFLVDKRLLPKKETAVPGSIKFLLAPDDTDISNLLTVFAESGTHILYKIAVPLSDIRVIYEERFDEPIVVTVSEPKTYSFIVEHSKYRIEMDASTVDQPIGTARWQINWSNKEGIFTHTSIVPFAVDSKTKHYSSPLLVPVRPHDYYGILYLTSSDEQAVEIKQFSLSGISDDNLVESFGTNNLKENPVFAKVLNSGIFR